MSDPGAKPAVRRRAKALHGAPTTPDPLEIAMAAAASGRPPEGDAAVLLRRQARLVSWQTASERAGFALKLMTGVAAVAAALLLAVMVWSASRVDGLVFEPFSVPPALAQQGVTGEALARQTMDRFADMAQVATSAEAQRAMTAGGAGDISIEIPQTGVSLTQVQQWLRVTLGRQSRITGELSQAPDGTLTLVTRSGLHPFPPATGARADLPAMIKTQAEAIYAREQPRSYMNYLGRVGRMEEALAQARARLTWPSARDRAIGYNYMGIQARQRSIGEELRLFRQSIAEDPTFAIATGNYGRTLEDLGHAELAYAYQRKAIDLSKHDRHREDALARRGIDAAHRGETAVMMGDFAEARRWAEVRRQAGNNGFTRADAPLAFATAATGMHDLAAAQAHLDTFTGDKLLEMLQLRIAAQDWSGAVAAADAMAAARAAGGLTTQTHPTFTIPKAAALAKLGRLDEAAALIAPFAADCVPCALVRADVAEGRSDHAESDRWFAEASRLAPSRPQADEAWGRALLARGDAAGATRQFREASRRGPNWADPIEGLAEADLASGDARGAARRFETATRLAPRWGRLHLKWGEALAKLGEADAAKAKWQAAATMDLSPADRAALKAHGV